MRLPRSSGILLHPTCFPGPYGIGDIGGEAEEFIRFLARAKQRFWQILPLGPTGFGDSPYQSYSSFAGNPLLISPDLLLEEGLVEQEDLETSQCFTNNYVDYGAVIQWKNALIKKAYQVYKTSRPSELEMMFHDFCRREAFWLDDFSLFMALKETRNNSVWTSWEPEIVSRQAGALEKVMKELHEQIERYKFTQFLFFRQWESLRQTAHSEGVFIIGDVPFYVAHDSADVWANQHYFQLDDKGNPKVVAGVPPDYFSETGQLWGNPIYNWERMKEDGFEWWIQRVKATFNLVDIIRIDHFRGFEAYWEVPAGEPTAVNGKWVPCPGVELFSTFQNVFGSDLRIVAENLGVITPEVEALREQFHLHGMAVFQFGFGKGAASSAYPLYKYTRDIVAYTGTHDNETLLAWWENLKSTKDGRATRRYIREYLSLKGKDFHWQVIRALMASVADVVIFPVQDILGLGNEARMNRPGSPYGNWRWRMPYGVLDDKLCQKLRFLVEVYGREESFSDFPIQGSTSL